MATVNLGRAICSLSSFVFKTKDRYAVNGLMYDLSINQADCLCHMSRAS